MELPCPGEEVVFTCTDTGGIGLSWTVTTSVGGSFMQSYLTSSPVDEPANHTIGDNQFQVVLTSTAPLTSTLTTTADTALDGTEVECASTTTETLTLQLLSK